MKRKIELLAPGGDVDSIKAAIAAGADAIYCGLNNFNARNRATNIEFDDLSGIVGLAHRHNCKIFLTLNIIMLESEIPALINLLNKLANTKIDGVIVQDLGLLYILQNHFKEFEVHASTQLTTHNAGQIKFLSRLGATRVNLSRELNLNEIKDLTSVAHENTTEIEVFVHGSNCICFSGLCYFSSVLEGKSGNRGRCSQPCRDQYLTTPEGKNFPLNLKDNSAYADLQEIYAAGVDSIKIEGRIKKFHYVYTVINSWRQQLDRLYNNQKLKTNDSVFYEIFNRDYTNAFLTGDIDRSMYIDNPRDNSATHLTRQHGDSSEESLKKAKDELHDKTTWAITNIKAEIDQLSIAKAPLTIDISGEAGSLLKVSIQTPDCSFALFSESELVQIGSRSLSSNGLDYANLLKRFNSLGSTEFDLEHLGLENLQTDLFIPFKELTAIKKKVLFTLNGSREQVEPFKLPRFTHQTPATNKTSLGVLISDTKDLPFCHESAADIFFQLPSCYANDYSDLIDIFSKNRELTPWFPAVLIGKDFTAALDILDQLKPRLIVSDNTGIAYEAYRLGIPWIAGPSLNIVNSFSLLCLKEKFNCSGAFISNEISQKQIKNINNPGDFKLYYSIYHPIQLITSRQCLLQQVIGCDKSRIDEDCRQNCTRSTSITNSKDVPLFIEKTEGGYHSIYNNHNFLNTDIVSDLPEIFSGFCIDLRDIKTETSVVQDRSRIIRGFENLLHGDPETKRELKQMIHPSTNTQYNRGI